VQAPPGKQRENPRQIEILYLRQLLFRQAPLVGVQPPPPSHTSCYALTVVGGARATLSRGVRAESSTRRTELNTIPKANKKRANIDRILHSAPSTYHSCLPFVYLPMVLTS